MAHTTSAAARIDARTTIQKAALVLGLVFLLVGILGFVPGVTQNIGDLALAGHESGAMLLGVFQVSILHNIVHLLFGVWGIMAARTVADSHRYLLVGGIVYLVLWLYGVLTGDATGANFVPVNSADDLLHLVLGLVMVGLALTLRRRRGH